MTEPIESRPPVSELDHVLAPAVAAARAADVPDEVVRSAIERLAALGVARELASPERTVRGRLALLVAALAGAGFWTMVSLRWLTVLIETHSYGAPHWRTVLAIALCGVLLNVVLLAAGHLLSRRAL